MFSLLSFTDKSELLREVQRRIQNPVKRLRRGAL